MDKYKLTTDKKQNQLKLENAGYVFGDLLLSQTLSGIYVKTEAVGDEASRVIEIKRKVSTNKHGIYLLHATDELKKVIGLETKQTKAILERLFKKQTNKYKKLLNLDTQFFYTFIINNE